MKIANVYLSNFRNDEHFRFHTEFRDRVIAAHPKTLRIDTQFDSYLVLYERIDEMLKQISENAFIKDIRATEQRCEAIFRNMEDIVRVTLNHFRAEVVESAHQLQIVFNIYGSFIRCAFKEQASAMHNLLRELKGVYAIDVNMTGIFEWVQEFERNYQTFDNLVKTNYNEQAQRADVTFRGVRLEIDNMYHTIARRIETFVAIEDAKNYETFVRQLNRTVAKYNNILG
jgi:hypothetical protein